MNLPDYMFKPQNVQEIQNYKKRLRDIGIDEAKISFPPAGIIMDRPMGPSLIEITLRNESLPADEAAIARLSRADPSDIKAIGVSALELSTGYYKEPLKQSQQSFLLMRIAAVIFLILFVAAIVILILQKPVDIAYISMIGGAISALFSGVFFLMYRHASNQALAYKPQVDRTQNFIMANSACETMDEEKKHRNREELIRWFVGLPS